MRNFLWLVALLSTVDVAVVTAFCASSLSSSCARRPAILTTTTGRSSVVLFNGNQQEGEGGGDEEESTTSTSTFEVSNKRDPQQRQQQQQDEDASTSLDEFLDKPFFDPENVTEDDIAPIRWFAELVKNDYATAETLYAGGLFLVLVVISQEILRMQIYGDGYVPFQAGVKPGQLF